MNRAGGAATSDASAASNGHAGSATTRGSGGRAVDTNDGGGLGGAATGNSGPQNSGGTVAGSGGSAGDNEARGHDRRGRREQRWGERWRGNALSGTTPLSGAVSDFAVARLGLSWLEVYVVGDPQYKQFIKQDAAFSAWKTTLQ